MITGKVAEPLRVVYTGGERESITIVNIIIKIIARH